MTPATFSFLITELEQGMARFSGDKSDLDRLLGLVEELKDRVARDSLGSDAQEDLEGYRTFFELSALVHLEARNTEQFKTAYTQLQPFYFELNEKLPPSGRMNFLVSVWMLHLLSENKIGDLYMLLERIPAELRRDPKVAYVIELERLMMEGDLGRLLDLNDGRSEYYKIIANTVRNRIAASVELSYKELDLGYLMRVLKLKDQNEMLDFIAYYNQYKLQQDSSSPTWRVSGSRVVFHNDSLVKHRIPSRELLTNSLEYLNDLEKII